MGSPPSLPDPTTHKHETQAQKKWPEEKLERIMENRKPKPCRDLLGLGSSSPWEESTDIRRPTPLATAELELLLPSTPAPFWNTSLLRFWSWLAMPPRI